MDRSEFGDGVSKLEGKKVVIVGCGAQGLNQGLNMRDSGLDVSFTLREAAITEKKSSDKDKNGIRTSETHSIKTDAEKELEKHTTL